MGGKRIYIAGDMDAKEAADLINTIAPEIAIPTHYGSVVGSPADAETFAKNVKETTKVVTLLKNP